MKGKTRDPVCVRVYEEAEGIRKAVPALKFARGEPFKEDHWSQVRGSCAEEVGGGGHSCAEGVGVHSCVEEGGLSCVEGVGGGGHSCVEEGEAARVWKGSGRPFVCGRGGGRSCVEGVGGG